MKLVQSLGDMIEMIPTHAGFYLLARLKEGRGGTEDTSSVEKYDGVEDFSAMSIENGVLLKNYLLGFLKRMMLLKTLIVSRLGDK